MPYLADSFSTSSLFLLGVKKRIHETTDMFHYNTPDKPWIHSSISFYFQQFNHPKLFGVLMTTHIVHVKPNAVISAFLTFVVTLNHIIITAVGCVYGCVLGLSS